MRPSASHNAPHAAVSAADALSLHPSLWRAHQLGRAAQRVWPTGFQALDTELPGGGWPVGVLTELLLPRHGVGELRLLAPALRGRPEVLMLVDPPHRPCAQAWAQLGLSHERMVLVQGHHAREGRAQPRQSVVRQALQAPELLWALEQALRSGEVGGVLAWLSDHLRADALRRLQLAAQLHEGPVFLLRGIEARLKPSPAPLRLALHLGDQPDALKVQVLKRQGPALLRPVALNLQPVLPEPARQRWVERHLVEDWTPGAESSKWRREASPAEPEQVPEPLPLPP